MKFIKAVFAAAILAAGVTSLPSFAGTSGSVGYIENAGPLQYSSLFGCSWSFTSSSGGPIGQNGYWVAFYYQPVGSCPYTSLNVSHTSGTTGAWAVAN